MLNDKPGVSPVGWLKTTVRLLQWVRLLSKVASWRTETVAALGPEHLQQLTYISLLTASSSFS